MNIWQAVIGLVAFIGAGIGLAAIYTSIDFQQAQRGVNGNRLNGDPPEWDAEPYGEV